MIFNCPECSAGHSVPVSMIPNGGLDMDCRRCGEAFTIEPPVDGLKLEDASDDAVVEELADAPDLADVADMADIGDESDGDVQAEKTSVGPPPVEVMESTRVGVANPLDFEEESPPLIGPGGIEHQTDEFTAGGDTDETTEELPEHDDSELDNTLRFDQAPEDEPPFSSPSITDPGIPEHAELSDSAPVPGLDEPPSISDSSPSVYERVAAGIPVPEEQRSFRSSSLSMRQAVEKPRTVFQPVIDLLNRAPLALKVGLIVFPVTLGVMLVVNSMNDDKPEAVAPIEIPVAGGAPVQHMKAPPPARQAEEPERKEAEVVAPPPPVVHIDDAPAAQGFAYVQIEDVRLRVRPGEKSGIAGRVPIGGLVRVYDEIGGFSLVASLPNGPAGFVSRKLLGARKPLALLARDQSFGRCTAEEGYSVDDCLFAAKQQEGSCLDRCGAVNAGDEAERLRCAEVCSIAFQACAASCSQTEPRPDKGKKRRR